jgi:hypothetical protein
MYLCILKFFPFMTNYPLKFSIILALIFWSLIFIFSTAVEFLAKKPENLEESGQHCE